MHRVRQVRPPHAGVRGLLLKHLVRAVPGGTAQRGAQGGEEYGINSFTCRVRLGRGGKKNRDTNSGYYGRSQLSLRVPHMARSAPDPHPKCCKYSNSLLCKLLACFAVLRRFVDVGAARVRPTRRLLRVESSGGTQSICRQ